MNDSASNNEQELDMIDIKGFISDFIHSFKRLWWVVVLLIGAAAAFSYFRVNRSYTPSYTAEATVSVELVNGGSFASRNTAEQMGIILPYVLNSGMLSEVIAADMNVSSVPGTINASCIRGTNLLTITVTGNNPELTYRVLQSVIKNYSEVAQYVVGQTELTVIDDRGIPTDTGKTAVVRGSVLKWALIGAAIGLAVVVLRSLIFRTIRSEDELRSFINAPFLGTLPICRKKERRKSQRTDINILFDPNRDEYVEAMRLIRTRIERDVGLKKVLMVTSSVAGEGKSTVAANLAASMALKGLKVILVDCDLRNPSVGRMFNLTDDFPGLASVLKGKTTIEDALIEVLKDGQPTGLAVMPGSGVTSRMAEILSGNAMSEVIEALRGMADMVILDTPPSAVLVDAMMLLKQVDGVVYVIMSDYARRSYIIRGIEEIADAGKPVTGCILNGGRTSSSKYGYYGRYGSKYGYYGYSSGSRE